MVPLSVLDLAPIVEGSDASTALRRSLELARHVERLGYRRFWLAEHHNFAGIASAATAVVIAHIAAGTSTIRVGAGGVMLPNHAPLVIAEQFGTLAAIHGDRIDLGLGRAPGTDAATSRALRRGLDGDVDAFPDDVIELLEYLGPPMPGQVVRAIPGVGTEVPVWILGSSLYGAQLAAVLGLPFSFASHFAPAQLDAALRIYRETFRPSRWLDAPYTMAALNVVAADDDDTARALFTSVQQAFVRLRSGRAGKLPPPVPGFEATLGPSERAIIDDALSCAVVGGPAAVRAGVAAFRARTAANELIVTAQIYDHDARLRSYEILADAVDLAPVPTGS